MFDMVLQPWGMRFAYADFSVANPVEAIPTGTRMVWLETPTNPLLKVSDIAAVAARCKAVGALLVVDNTFATPYFQRPLALGADLVVHGVTKYINGHSDVVGGFAALNDESLHTKMKFLQNAAGAVPGPQDVWLTLRGVKTLGVRMERHQSNAARILEFLRNHPEVARVYHPMDSAVARTQMSGFGGMISFDLVGDLERARRFVAATKLFTLAESLGGVESLIETPALMTHASIEPEKRRAAGIEDGLIRLSVGIESADDLVADLAHAFEASR